MQTVIVDVTNEKALRLLKNLEELDLIRLRKYPHQEGRISSTYYDIKGGNVLRKSNAETDRKLEAQRRDWE